MGWDRGNFSWQIGVASGWVHNLPLSNHPVRIRQKWSYHVLACFCVGMLRWWRIGTRIRRNQTVKGLSITPWLDNYPQSLQNHSWCPKTSKKPCMPTNVFRIELRSIDEVYISVTYFARFGSQTLPRVAGTIQTPSHRATPQEWRRAPWAHQNKQPRAETHMQDIFGTHLRLISAQGFSISLKTCCFFRKCQQIWSQLAVFSCLGVQWRLTLQF